MRRFWLIVLLLCGYFMAQADDNTVVVGADTLSYTYTPINSTVKTKKSGFREFLSHYGSYPNISNQRRFNYSFMVVPSYSRLTNFGLSASVIGFYNNSKESNNAPPSSVSLTASASLTGAYSLGVAGENIFSSAAHRLKYSLALYSYPTDFWGVGYDAAMMLSSQSCTESAQRVALGYYYSPIRTLSLGTQIGFEHVHYNTTLLPVHGASATNLSLIAEYDSRDSKTGPTKGIFLRVQGTILPKGLGSIDTTSTAVILSASGYCKLWQGAVLAAEAHGELRSKTTPWLFYSTAGDSNRMRGYYSGRFRDRNMVFAQVELRQKVWRGVGLAVWGGAGNWFGYSDFEWKHTLPTYGVGLRFSASERVNLRLDYGLGAKVGGKVINGFVFSVGEAF